MKRSNTRDCKSFGFSLRGFESLSLHQIISTMKISRADALVRKVDDAVTIEELFNGKDFQFDFVISRLSGKHPTHINHASDRVYFILSGQADVTLDGVKQHVQTHDLVLIPKGTPHGIEGNAEFIIITAPPFKPENETIDT